MVRGDPRTDVDGRAGTPTWEGSGLLAGKENIREVIAFQRTQSGADPLTGAPTAIDQNYLAIYGLRALPKPT